MLPPLNEAYMLKLLHTFTFFGHCKSKKILTLQQYKLRIAYRWIFPNAVVELARRGSVTNGATLSIFIDRTIHSSSSWSYTVHTHKKLNFLFYFNQICHVTARMNYIIGCQKKLHIMTTLLDTAVYIFSKYFY